MIKYADGEPRSVLSPPVTDDTDTAAISYAVKMAAAKLIAYAAKTRLYADIDSLPEELLDMLAAELQTVYYDSSLDLETKRGLVKNTLLWYMRAGTTGAVEELAAVVFGNADVSEWYDYGGEAYYFKLSTISEGAAADADALDQLEQIIANVKNVRSWLEGVSFETDYEGELLISFGAVEREELTDAGTGDDTEIAIIVIDDDTVISTDFTAADADSDGLYDTIASDDEISAAYEDGKLIITMPSDTAWEEV